MRVGLLLCVSLASLASCGNKDAKVSREDCAKVADHIADLIMDHMQAHPDELWEQVKTEQTGLPASVTKETLPQFIETPEGKTWLLQRRGFTRSGVEQGVDTCVQKATRKQVTCLLAAKSREDVTACDSAK
jgi:hypothetical protein